MAMKKAVVGLQIRLQIHSMYFVPVRGSAEPSADWSFYQYQLILWQSSTLWSA